MSVTIKKENNPTIANIMGGKIPINFRHGYELVMFDDGIKGMADFTFTLKFPRSEDVTICFKEEKQTFTVFLKENGQSFPDSKNYSSEWEYQKAQIKHLNWCLNIDKIADLLKLYAAIELHATNENSFDAINPCEAIYQFRKTGIFTLNKFIAAICKEMSKDAGKTKVFSTQNYPWELEY